MKRTNGLLSQYGIAKGLYVWVVVLLWAVVGPMLVWPMGALGQAASASVTAADTGTTSPDAPKTTTPAPPPAQTAGQGQVVLTAFPATMINKVLPKWLRFSGEYRLRPEDHTAYSFTAGNNDAFFLSRLKLNMSIIPTSWLSAFVQMQDSEALGIKAAHITPSNKDKFDLHQAYLQLQNGENGWIRFRAGRQELRYGQERLIGVSDWVNAPRVFDGFRLVLGTDKDHVDVFSTSVVVNSPLNFDLYYGGLNFHGVYGSITSVIPKSSIEPYVLWKALPFVVSGTGVAGHENLWTYGGRWTGKAPLNFDYTIEAAKQSGNYSTDSIQAGAAYANVGFSIPKIPLKPRFTAQYDYATGNNNPKDGVMGRFDQLYPSNHDVFGLVDLLGWENIMQERAGVGVQPINHLVVSFDFRQLYLANGNDSLYSSTGSVLVKSPSKGALSRDVGQEPDLYAKYDVRYNITVGAGYGYLFAGPFLTDYSKGDRATIAYTFGTYKF